jgi:2-amino-4-hydroxy-6-hydroxymethyldihydropteridine diphosphokinase
LIPDKKTSGRVPTFLALGSHLGDRLENLRQARNNLTQQVVIIKSSSIYETPPWGVLDQPPFLNQVVEAHTDLSPLELLTFIKQIELEMGRVKSERYGPRLIDIDILLYGDQIINLPDLVIPHPYMIERAFVLVPLTEIQPNLVIPGENRIVKEFLNMVNTSGILMFKNPQ